MLTLSRISKRFGPVQALDRVDLAIRPGTVHALLGENGAGKSTLMHIAYGLVHPDLGEIRVDDRPVSIDTPRAARSLGIGMVHQHFTSVPALTVDENIRLAGGRLAPGRAPVLDRFLERLPLAARAEDLSVGARQQLEIVKALATDARILLLDEPTAVLAPSETEELIAALRAFAAAGGSVVLITHKLDEALKAADEVTVLRRGRRVLHSVIGGVGKASLADAMIGGEESRRESTAVEESRRESKGVEGGRRESRPDFVILRDLSVAPLADRGPGLTRATVALLSGEIVGVAAIEGNGQRELMLAVAGLLPPASGTLEVRQPVALVPEDRTTEGLIPELTITENVVLGSGRESPWIKGRWIDWPLARIRAAELVEAFEVRTPSAEARALLLSGGNQQKLVLARALARDPAVLVVENPTRGLDIRATAVIHQRLREAAASGITVLLYSSDLDEVLELADRIVVVARGRLTEAPRDRAVIGRMMLGLEAEAATA